MDCLGFIKRSKKHMPPCSSSSIRHVSSAHEVVKESPAPSADARREKVNGLRAFDFAELHEATKGFSMANRIGEGGFGSVYKGFIKSCDPSDKNKVQVAIKKLVKESLQGDKEWMAEIQFLSVVNHPNLVKLLGYCGEDHDSGIQRLLVYEFMPNKSLEEHLFSRAQPPLTWKTRVNIMHGVAQGLQYLHEELSIQVIYRDFKASNVLLDKDFNAKLSDFGMAREGPSDGRSHVTTAVMGTEGYAAPDYIKTGHLTTKSDVYSFGVVLFEMLTGRYSFDPRRPKSEIKLLQWVKEFPIKSRKFTMIMDPRLDGKYSLSAARSIANLANICLSEDPKSRPTMAQVVESLTVFI